MHDERTTENSTTYQPEREDAWALLLDWYAREGRHDLPWRHTRDPYAVLVSEIMLQQTQVERVLPKYRTFLARFPTLTALAEAPASDVIRAWAGLGYNTRAVRLQQIARQAVAEFGGRLPGSLEGLLALKGIGRYTAGAVACFALELPVATVDTNIRRVLWRVFRGIEPATWPTGERATREHLALAEWALPSERAYDWQQALMDLGATVCLGRRPLCERCPLTSVCAAYAEMARTALFPSGEALARLRDERRVAETQAEYDAAPDGRKRKSREKAVPFTMTTRYFRGRVVDALRNLPHGESLALETLGPLVKPEYTQEDAPWLLGIVRGLARDSLVILEDGDAGAVRVALPV